MKQNGNPSTNGLESESKRISRLKKLYDLSMTLSGDPLDVLKSPIGDQQIPRL